MLTGEISAAYRKKRNKRQKTQNTKKIELKMKYAITSILWLSSMSKAAWRLAK